MNLWKSNEETKWIIIRQPSSDVCDTCWLYKYIVSATDTQEGLGESVLDQWEHLQWSATMKEEYKNDVVNAAAGGIQCFSFDYSQNIALPNSSRVPAKFYFLSLYNVSCFGMCNEGKCEQVN